MYSGLKIRRNFSGAERSSGAVSRKIGVAERSGGAERFLSGFLKKFFDFFEIKKGRAKPKMTKIAQISTTGFFILTKRPVQNVCPSPSFDFPIFSLHNRSRSKIFSGAERSGGAVSKKIGGAERSWSDRSAPLRSTPLKYRSVAPRILNPACIETFLQNWSPEGSIRAAGFYRHIHRRY